MERTTITVSDEVWQYLNKRKSRGDSFDDVLRRQLGIAAEVKPSGAEVKVEPETEQAETQARYENVEFPSTKRRDECLEAVDAAVEYLRAHERATMRDLVREVMPEHSLGYDVPELESGERYRGAWWRRVIKPCLEADERVAKPQTGGSEWRWVGPK